MEENKDDEYKKRFLYIMKMIYNLKASKTGELENLGEPDAVEIINDGKYKYKRYTWYRDGARITKTESASHFTPEEYHELRKLGLKERLEEAIEEEDYELAANLRDKIKELNEKKSETEAIENEDIMDEDSWNF